MLRRKTFGTLSTNASSSVACNFATTYFEQQLHPCIPQGILCTSKVSLCSQCVSMYLLGYHCFPNGIKFNHVHGRYPTVPNVYPGTYILKCRCFPNGISGYPMYIEGISRYMSQLLLKVSFKVSFKVALKLRDTKFKS